MKWTKKRTKEPGPAVEKAAGKIAGGVLLVQEKWAGWMQGLSERLSTRTKLFSLILFITAGVLVSTFHIRSAFSGSTQGGFQVGSIRQPMLPAESAGAVITDREFLNIQRFKIYLDSLARSPTGKRKRDSILLNRAGLMDSIALIEEQYRVQHIKKGR